MPDSLQKMFEEFGKKMTETLANSLDAFKRGMEEGFAEIFLKKTRKNYSTKKKTED